MRWPNRERWRPVETLWLANFWGALTALTVLKIASMLVSVFSTESGGYEPEWKEHRYVT